MSGATAASLLRGIDDLGCDPRRGGCSRDVSVGRATGVGGADVEVLPASPRSATGELGGSNGG